MKIIFQKFYQEYKSDKKLKKEIKTKTLANEPEWFNKDIEIEEDIEKQKELEKMLNGV